MVLKNLSKWTLVLSLITTPFIATADLQEAYVAFQKKDYTKAAEHFEPSAKLGHYDAQGAMGVLHQRGINGVKDLPKAYAYFSLAYAQQPSEQLKKSKQQLLAVMSAEQRSKAEALWQEYSKLYGQQALSEKSFPHKLKKIKRMRQPRRLTSGQQVTRTNFYKHFSNISSMVVSYDIAPDGSVRDIEPVFNFGMRGKMLSSIIDATTGYRHKSQKDRDNGPVYYGARTTWSKANINLNYIRDEEPKFYRQLKKLEQSADEGNGYAQYQFGMYVYAFPSLERNKMEYADYMMLAAKQFIPEAEVEYAYLLLAGRHGVTRDVKQGLMYLLDAAQSGHANGQYRLARQFLAGTVVKKDEKKALFWLQQAAKQQHVQAKFWLGRLYASIEDPSLRQPKQAITLLEELKKEKRNNPYWYYFLSHAYQQIADLDEAEDLLDDAIDLAKEYKWNTNQWEAEYKKLKAHQS